MIELLLASMALAVGGSFFIAEEDDPEDMSDDSDENSDVSPPDATGTDLLDDLDEVYKVNSDNGIGNLIEGTAADEPFLVSVGDTVLGNEGDDTIDALAGVDLVEGGGGNDQIVLDDDGAPGPGGYVQFLGDGFQHIDEDRDFTTIRGGDGDDRITIEEGSADIFTGDGNDTVDASGLEAGIVHANAGDVVLGSDVAGRDRFGVTLEGGAVFRGGDAGEMVFARGDGSEVDGGAGRDFLYSDEGAATLRGGGGDDTLVSHAEASRYDESTRNTFFGQWVDTSADVLDGGAGNDRLEISNGDTGTGGDGDDYFSIHYRFDDDAPSAEARGLGPPVVTDFAPGSDTASLKIDEGFDETYTPGEPELDLAGRIDVTEDGGDTQIRVDGEIATILKDVTGVKVGYSDRGSYEDVVDAETGAVADRSEFDFVVEFFFARIS